MSEINGIEERLDDLPGSEATSRLTASRASGSTQLFGGEMEGIWAARAIVWKHAENARV